jgi:di/tricarboxylate transporter
VQRRGEDVGPESVRLAVGDTLLLQGQWEHLDREMDTDRDVLVVDDPALVRRQAAPLGRKSAQAAIITVVMVLMLATGVVPAAAAGLLAAGAIVVTGVLTMPQLYRSISWPTVVLVAGMIPLSTAMQVSGAADDIANVLVDVVGDAGPRVLLFGLFLLAASIGSFISNTATALVLIPIAVSASVDLGVSPKPVLLAVGVSCAAAFLTPITTPANLMVMGPGGYRFGDYWKFGLPLLLFYGVVVVFYIPLIWRF